VFSQEVIAKVEGLRPFGGELYNLLIELDTVNYANRFQEDVFSFLDGHDMPNPHAGESSESGITQ